MKCSNKKRNGFLLVIYFFMILQILNFASCGNKKPTDNANINTAPYGDGCGLSEDNNEQTNNNNNGNETAIEKFIVRFITDNGIPVDIKECKKGEALNPPTPPRRIGYVFTDWNGNYHNITQNTDIIATYRDVSKIANAICADTVYISGESEFEVLIAIYGEVSFCGLDMDITYDGNLLELVASTDVDDCVMLNDATMGVIHMNYVTTSNTTGEVSFMTLKFKPKVNTKNETSLQINVNSMYSLDSNDVLVKSEYQVLQNKIIMEELHDEQ